MKDDGAVDTVSVDTHFEITVAMILHICAREGLQTTAPHRKVCLSYNCVFSNPLIMFVCCRPCKHCKWKELFVLECPCCTDMVKVFLDHQPFFTVLKRIGDNWKKKMRQVFLQRPFARPFGSALLKEFHACGLTEDNLRIIFRSVQLLDHLPFAQSMVEVAMQILMFCDEHDNIYTETTSMQEAIAISMLHFSDAAGVYTLYKIVGCRSNHDS